MTKQDKTAMVLLAVVLLILVYNFQSPGVFLLYGGTEINATISNETNFCWTLAQNYCAKQRVAMLELVESGLLICPEGYYSTVVSCESAFGLTKVPEVPKIKCYYVQDDKCFEEEFVEKCPTAGYFTSKQSCEESLIDLGYSAKRLFGSTKAIILTIIGGIALLIMVFSFFRRR